MATVEELERRIAILEHKLETVLEERVGRLEDVEAVKQLQRMYGYYIDMLLYDEMTELFTEDGSMEVGQRGRYVGKENVRRFLKDVLGGKSQPGLHRNQIINHTQHQPIVTIGADGKSAAGRWRALVQAGSRPPTGGDATPEALAGAMMWSDGVYENTYRKEDGIWKIHRFWWSPTFYATLQYENLWFDTAPVSKEFPPQEASHPLTKGLGRTFVPYHYRHPVTGKVVEPIILDD